MAGTTSTVRVLFTGDSASAVRSVKQLEGGFGGLNKVAGVTAKVLGVGIVGGLAAATKAALTFDREMRNVNTLAKLNEKQFQQLNKQVLALSKETGQAPKTLAKGLYDIVSSGFKANDALKILRVSGRAASAGLTDTATATKAINAALNAYHLQATDARKVSDILFQTVNKGVLTFEELAQNMGDLVPAAAPLGVSLEEVGAAIATITLQGVPAAEAATRVKNTMLQLASPSKALKGLLHDVGYESAEAAIHAQGFSGVLTLLDKATHGNVTATAALTPEIRSLLGVVGLTGKNLKTYEANVIAMKKAQEGAGATNKAYAEQGKSIAVQWDRTKAALTAAAIPLGQQLFPLLQAGAGRVQEFAEQLPELEARFGRLAGATGDFAHALGQVANNREGQAAIIALLGASVASNAAGKFSAVAASIRGMSAASTVLVGAAAILAGGLFYLATAADKNAQALDNLRRASGDLADSTRSLSDARLREKQTAAAVETAELALERARRNASEVLRSHTRDSLEYREAANAVKLAEQALTQANVTAKQSRQDVARAELQHRDALKAATRATHDAREAAERLLLKEQASSYSSDKNRLSKEGVRDALDKYAEAIRSSAKAAGNAVAPTDAYSKAVQALYVQLGRLPSVKEVRIYVRTIQTLDRLEGNRSSAPLHRAGGGFVPMQPGANPNADSVPAMLTPGEMVLNRSQQEKLGGPAFLASLFGFGGNRGPGFARGGIAGSGNPMHRLRPRRYQRTSAAANRALAAVARVNQQEENLQRAYGQMQRGFDISQENFITTTTDADGNEVEMLNAADVAQRLSEISQLIASRKQMIALIDREKAELEKAIAELKRAIKALLDAIRQEQDAASSDARQARELARQIAANEKATDAARNQDAKTHAQRQARSVQVRGLEAEGRRLRASQRGAEQSRSKHLDKARDLRGQVSDFRSALVDAQGSLANDIPFDRKDVQLDIRELQRDAADVRAIKPRPAPGASPDTGGGGGTSPAVGGGGGGGDSTGTLQALLEAMQAQNTNLRFALGVQAAQMPILGSFRKGTIHVPADGVYQLHAGEQVVKAGTTGPAAATSGPVNVTVNVAPGMEWLQRFISIEVDGATHQIMENIGREADRRLRAGG